jgi:ribosome-binding factor A
MTTRRIERINELLRHEISEIIHREIKDPGIGFVTIIRVETTSDLYYSTIHTGVMGDERVRARTIERLNKAAGFIQHELSGRLTFRNMPRISFKLDSSVDDSIKIDEILQKIAKKKAEGKDSAKEEEKQDE